MSRHRKGKIIPTEHLVCRRPSKLRLEQDWQPEARCKDTPTQAFYIDQYDATAAEVIEIQLLCLSCEVRAECLWTAIERKEKFGIWGGATPDQRVDIRRRYERSA